MRAKLTGLCILLISLSGLSLPAFSEGKGAIEAPKSSESTQLSDAQIKKFAQAQQSIQQMLQANRQTMQKGTPKEKAKLQQDMKKAIKDAGLTVAKFNAIGQKIQSDQSLKQRFMEQMSN